MQAPTFFELNDSVRHAPVIRELHCASYAWPRAVSFQSQPYHEVALMTCKASCAWMDLDIRVILASIYQGLKVRKEELSLHLTDALWFGFDGLAELGSYPSDRVDSDRYVLMPAIANPIWEQQFDWPDPVSCHIALRQHGYLVNGNAQDIENALFDKAAEMHIGGGGIYTAHFVLMPTAIRACLEFLKNDRFYRTLSLRGKNNVRGALKFQLREVSTRYLLARKN
jgi:hypothetical protein